MEEGGNDSFFQLSGLSDDRAYPLSEGKEEGQDHGFRSASDASTFTGGGVGTKFHCRANGFEGSGQQAWSFTLLGRPLGQSFFWLPWIVPM